MPVLVHVPSRERRRIEEAHRIENRISHGANTSTNQVANSHDDAMHLSYFICNIEYAAFNFFPHQCVSLGLEAESSRVYA